VHEHSVLSAVYFYLSNLRKPHIDFDEISSGERGTLEKYRDRGDSLSSSGSHGDRNANFKSGYLNKLGTEGISKGVWKPYHCTVSGGEFSFSHRVDSSKGERILLSKTYCIAVDAAGQENCFSLVSRPGHAVYFQAASGWLRQIWIDKCIANGSHPAHKFE